MPTPNFGLPLYTTTDTAALDTLLNGQSSAIDSALLASEGRVAMTNTARLALTAPRLKEGLVVYATDTNRTWFYDGSSWILQSPALVRVQTNIAQSISNAVFNDVTFASTTDIVSFGDGISLNAATGVVTVSEPGYYRITGHVTWAAGGASPSSHLLVASKNNQTTVLGSALARLDATNVLTGQSVDTVFQCAASDTLRLKVSQNSGASKNIYVSGASYYTQLLVQREISV